LGVVTPVTLSAEGERGSGTDNRPTVEKAVRLDVWYVANWSLSLDLVILLRTVSAVVRSPGAY